jgi:ABC-2 type transport system ATP-binding protein
MQNMTARDAGILPDALEVSAVTHAYGRKEALSNVSFTIARGRFTVLLGLNGAGKTTLFSLICHLYDVRHGRIRIFGHDVALQSGEALRRLGIVFQARTLDLDLSIYQNLAYHASLHGISRPLAAARIGHLLAQVGMLERLHHKVRSLSGGQMRRIEIARALLHHPPLLLLDEATVGLDVQSREEIIAAIRGLVTTEGISVLWATHLIDEVDIDDHVVLLHRGKVLANARVSDVVSATRGAENIRQAFAALTQTGSHPRERT